MPDKPIRVITMDDLIMEQLPDDENNLHGTEVAINIQRQRGISIAPQKINKKLQELAEEGRVSIEGDGKRYSRR